MREKNRVMHADSIESGSGKLSSFDVCQVGRLGIFFKKRPYAYVVCIYTLLLIDEYID